MTAAWRGRLAILAIIAGAVAFLPTHPALARTSIRWMVDTQFVSSTESVSAHIGSASRQGLLLDVQSRDRRHTAALDIVASGPVMIVAPGIDDLAEDIVTASESPRCKRDVVAGQWTCHIPVTTPVRRLIVAEGTGAVQVDAHLRWLKSVPVRDYGSNQFAIVTLLLLVLTPVLWVIHQRRAASQWVIVAAAVTGLAALDAMFSAILLAALSLLYFGGRHSSVRVRRTTTFVGIIASVALLVGWRYLPPLIQLTFAINIGLAGAVPIGLSYFVFRMIDTQLRWRRGEQLTLSFREYLCFLLFPATIPAGPIESVDSFYARRLERITSRDIVYGVSRICLGVLKKLVIADLLINHLLFGDRGSLFFAMALDPASASRWVILGTLALSFAFAYVDFSAYSDLAIGVGRLHGYRIRENFDWPILASSLQEFWRRWHMSLSAWCMRNLYFPLVLTTRNTILPLFVTMLVIGLWHEFDWSWFAWGIHHTIGLIVSVVLAKTATKRKWGFPRLRHVLAVTSVLVFVTAGHAFVGVGDFHTATVIYARFWRALLPW
ncbi:MAG TPA: MBOAT family O-acyltransferase [Gemmatimonadaceae bacterium]|jgi:alginate O-acetyltransferase complex protein AlgI